MTQWNASRNQSMTKLIPFIHNYCDRWCERCPFTSRCAVFAREQEMTDAELDHTNEAFWQNLSNIFAETKQMLYQMAEERGIDLDAIDDTEIEKAEETKRQKVKQDRLTNLARDYYKKVDKLLETESLFGNIDEQFRFEMFSIIRWYQFFISAKIQRGLHGIQDDFDDDDFPKDYDGSIKIALIVIERSIMAWTSLLRSENLVEIKPIIFLLEKIRRSAEEKFPLARDFIRPGFDEIETIM